jgi:hypothetical protein
MPTEAEKKAYADRYYAETEAKVEAAMCSHARRLGCWVAKFKSKDNRGVPDRIIITPDGVVFFVEVKKPLVKDPRRQQKLVIEEMVEHGAIVFVTNDKDVAIQIIDDMVAFGECDA